MPREETGRVTLRSTSEFDGSREACRFVVIEAPQLLEARGTSSCERRETACSLQQITGPHYCTSLFFVFSEDESNELVVAETAQTFRKGDLAGARESRVKDGGFPG
jgi:hypothetical protein